MRKQVAEKQRKEDAVLEYLDKAERMAVDVAAAIVECCQGIVDNVVAVPTGKGYAILVDDMLTVEISLPSYPQPTHAVGINVSTPLKKIGHTTVLSHSVDDAVRFALGAIGE